MANSRSAENIEYSESFVASVVDFLIQGGDNEAAALVAASDCWVDLEGNPVDGYRLHFTLCGSRLAVEKFKDGEYSGLLDYAIDAVAGNSNTRLHVQAKGISPDSGWRDEVLDKLLGKDFDNQARGGDSTVHFYNGMRFRSVTEVTVAKELDKRGMTYFPNCKGRTHTDGVGKNYEPDFLICAHGKWGILEVDGDHFHPKENTAWEHERDRAFRSKGMVVERFPASRCFNETSKVVDEFLRVLGSS